MRGAEDTHGAEIANESALATDLESAPVAAQPDPPPQSQPEGSNGTAPPRRGDPGRPNGEIFDGCPVKPLGLNGGTFYYLDIHGQLRGITNHEAKEILKLFGHMIPKLIWEFPQWTKDPDTETMRRKKDRFDQQGAAIAMVSACSERGLFDPDNAVRGVGAWSDDDGRLIYHMGDAMLIDGERAELQTHQGKIYPAFPPVPHPIISGEYRDPVPDLMDLLSTWQWTRPDADPFIVLGAIGVQMMGGALPWRPAYWFTGGPGTGKSALQRLMLHLHGGEKGLIQSTDATARGLAAILGQSSLPVALDELEPGDAGSHKERDIVTTMRVAASGGRWARGSSDQKGSTGQLRSTFLASSILIPGVLKSQDLQRMIMLNLNPFQPGAKAPQMRAEVWRRHGAVLKGLIVERWPTFAERLEMWREAFANEEITGRAADNWATTLAMAQMMQAEAMPTRDELAAWASKIAGLISADVDEIGSDADEVMTHLLSQPFDVFRRGKQFTVAQWIMVAAGRPGAPHDLLDGYEKSTETGREQRMDAANSHLATALIRVIRERDKEPRLFIGNSKAQPLLNLFANSQWAGGAWRQSLERIKGAKPSPVPRTLAGIRSRGIEIPVSSIVGLSAFPSERAAAEPRIDTPANTQDYDDFA